MLTLILNAWNYLSLFFLIFRVYWLPLSVSLAWTSILTRICCFVGKFQVVLYRTGLVTAATTFIAAGLTAFLPDDNALKSLLQGLYDPLYVVGAGGLGTALFLIHIYVTPIKRTLQALWAVGVLGSLGVAINFAAPENQGLVMYVVEHPAAIWAVGPLFASLTGLVFKEGKKCLSLVAISPACWFQFWWWVDFLGFL